MRIKDEYQNIIAPSERAIRFKPGDMLYKRGIPGVELEVVGYINDGYQIKYVGSRWTSSQNKIEPSPVYDNQIIGYSKVKL